MNLFELFVKIGVDDQASNKLQKITGQIGNGLKKAAKIGAAAVTAAATGIAALTTAAVKNYAEYEQLAGGVETLFKKSARKVMNYATAAYETAGLSANEYMATVTSFSASLLQGLEGDTEAAADYANQAIVDMADNANKMGTSIEMIQNAYQGFAKQNYTMLDNLKLGYGGTKTEMQRLIADANKVKEANGEMADLSIDSFADVTEAIHIMQEEMGIAGTTAKEASDTISGSLAAVKAQWNNLLTAISQGDDWDTGVYISNLIDTVSTAFKNLKPVIRSSLVGIVDLISELAPLIVEELPSLINTLLPKVLNAITSTLQIVAQELPGAIGSLFPYIISAVVTLTNLFLAEAPSLIDEVLRILPDLIDQVVAALVHLTPKLTQAVVRIVQAIADNLPAIIESLLDAIPVITDSVNQAILDNFPALLSAIIQIVLTIVKNLPQIIEVLVAQIEPIVSTIAQVLLENLPLLLEGVGKLILGIVKALPSLTVSLFNSVINVFKGIGTGIEKAWPKFKEGISNLWEKLTNWFSEQWENLKNIGKDIVNGILSGLKNAWANLENWFTNAWNDLVGGVKDFLGIRSPSKLFAGIGKNMALGVGEGWDDAFGDVEDDIDSSLDFGDVDYGITTATMSDGGMGNNGLSSVGGVSIIQNIYSEAKTAADLMQEALYQQERAVYLGV